MNAIVEKTNRGKYLAAVFAMFMVLAGAVIVLSDNGVDAATGETTYIHGGITAGTSGNINDQVYTGDSIVIVDGDLTIPEYAKLIINGATFTVQEGYTVTIEEGGAIEFKGNAKVSIDGTIEVEGATTDGAIINSTTYNSDAKTGVTVSGSLVMDNESNLVGTGNLFVKSGATVEINDGSSVNGQNFILDNGASLTYNGTTTSKFTVEANVTGSVYTSVKATISANSGDAKDISDLTFTVSSKNISGYTWNADTERAVSQTIRQYTMDVDGTVDNKETLTFEADNSTGFGTYFTSADYAEAYYGYNGVMMYDSVVSGIVSVTGSVTVESDASIVNMTHMIVSGDLSVNGESKKGQNDFGKVTNTGTVEVSGTVDMYGESIQDGMGTIAVNGGTVTIDVGGTDADAEGKNYLYGAYYTDSDDIMHISGLDAAIAGAVAAEIDQVYVWATPGSETEAGKAGSYTVSADLTIPDNIEVEINNGFLVASGATLTVSAKAEMPVNGMIYVDGKIVDNSRELEDAEPSNMTFEVKIVEGEGRDTINTYTSLATALKETSEGTIYLYNDVTVKGTMDIPAGVTVTYEENVTGDITLDKAATLNVNGTLVLTGEHQLVCNAEDATVNVNNVIKTNPDEETVSSIVGEIAGAHFDAKLGDDETDYHYITSVAYASENSAEIDGVITIQGTVAMGDVTFTKGEDAENLAILISNDGITADGKQLTTGNVTLAGGACIDFFGAFTGSVTDGANTVEFEKSYYGYVGFISEETVDGTVTTMVIASLTDDALVIAGKTTVSAGTVLVDAETTAIFDNLTIASGATLDVEGTLTIQPAKYNAKLIAEELPVYTEDSVRDTFGSLFVEGTLNVNETGSIGAAKAIAVIDGTLNVAERASTVFGGALVVGTINAENAVTISIVQVTGTINGDAKVDALIAMPGSTIVVDDIAAITAGTVESTVYYINGEEYATVYATVDVPVAAILIFADVPGVQIDSSVFYSDAAMTQEIRNVYVLEANEKFPAFPVDEFDMDALLRMFTDNTVIGDYDNVYIAMDPAEVEGTVSVGTGLDLYIDNVRVTGGQDFVLSVGTHTVSFDVKAGYDGANATITFNGQTVQNGGSITITADMTEYTLVASGAAPSQGQVVIDQTGGDDGMGITDYLLIILVILVIVLAIFVALRMMRS